MFFVIFRYKERITDLLSYPLEAEAGQPILKLKQDQDGKIYAENATFKHVNSSKEAVNLLKLAQSRRTTKATKMNKVSSRSHLIFQIEVTIETEGVTTQGILNLCDLAGNEKLKDSQAEGEALKEACAINTSLFNLAKVVEKLSLNKKDDFVPYRDSKLTWLLKNSLGGNCRTTLLAMVSPAQRFAPDSLSTLRFASACKTIINQDKANKYKSQITHIAYQAPKPKA